MNRDMEQLMNGEYVRLGSVLLGRQLPDGMAACEGGCGRLILDRFCVNCSRLNRHYMALQERVRMGFTEMPDDPDLAEVRLGVAEHPLLALVVGLAVNAVGGVALFWIAPQIIARVGLWLRAVGI